MKEVDDLIEGTGNINGRTGSGVLNYRVGDKERELFVK